MMKIEECLTRDPNAFWRYIKKIGPSRDESIPMEVEINGVISSDLNVVLEKWRSEFENLYCVSDQENFDKNFKKSKIDEMESFLLEGDVNSPLNRRISKEEVELVTNRSLRNKAVGLDDIPNELLKHPQVIKLMYSLFNLCLDIGMVPEIWKKSIIHPIPKDSGCHTDPLKYRGLALQSCIFKLFCSILNERLVSHLNDKDIIVDEQNGFRKDRSCLHHIFSLTSIVKKYIKKSKKGLFAVFIDFRKAFDYVDRALLANKLAKIGITGKIHTVLQSIHQDTMNIFYCS